MILVVRNFRVWKNILTFEEIFSSMEENFALLSKYNFWNGNVPELGFIRVGYIGIEGLMYKNVNPILC